MGDAIQLLSDHIANQIAAGEVIQRPASAVKELLENAIDAGATEIQLIIKDAGKELIQVIDNGKGMSPTDARMSFERHATSKIRNIDDLFSIRTMGFRGEALASIAAVAQVEMKTRKHDAEMGTRICIEGTEVIVQEPCAGNPGTNIMVKNLFFNVPARRNFLKSNNTEYRHILDEFTRVALANQNIGFRVWHNGTEQFRLEAGTMKSRIVGLLGHTYEKNLVPVTEDTEYIRIHGFIGKPEAATRTRGMQFFFINNRFIRNHYLNHAVVQAYEGLIEKESFPFYVLFIEIDPSRVDVNVHPTKQEVKFEDDRMMYAYLQAAVKHALARYNIAPSLDFSLSPEITQLPSVSRPVTDKEVTDTRNGYLYNTFTQKNQAHFIDKKDALKQWKDLYQIAQQTPEMPPVTSGFTATSVQTNNDELFNAPTPAGSSMLLVQGTYLITTVRSGMMMIHVSRAMQRIWYERLQQQWESGKASSQQLLFPVTYELPPQDCVLLSNIIPDLLRIGFDISPFGGQTFAIRGVPPGLQDGSEKALLDEVLDKLKNESSNAFSGHKDQLIKHLAKRMGSNGQSLQQPEQQQAIIDELFACSQPEYTPEGKKIFKILGKDSLEELLSK